MPIKTAFSALLSILLMVSAPAQALPAIARVDAPSAPALVRAFAHRVLARTQDPAVLQKLALGGAVLLEDYGAFSMWDVSSVSDSALAKNSLIEPREDYNTLILREATIDTLSAAPAAAAIPQSLSQTQTGSRFAMIQFYGPVKDEWLDALRKTGVEIVTYMAENAFVVFGDDASLSRMGAMAQANRAVQWTGAYHPYYRLSSTLRETAAQPQKGALNVAVQIYRTAEADATTARLIELAKSAGGGLITKPEDILVYRNIAVQLPAAALADVAAWPDVFAMREWNAPQKMDESQGQILAGNVISTNGKVAPTGPGYLAFLAAKGFPQDAAAYPIVDVVDDGIDIGVPASVQHPDFRAFGLAANPSRIVYANNCTSDPAADGRAGHGNLNAGIVAGYNNAAGFPFADASNYHLGLGISPYGRVANTKIFANDGSYDVVNCGGNDQSVVLKSYAAGANLTSNSWGSNANGAYDDSAQAYDALTRDANSNAADGNQQMLHVFSAGNAGAGGSHTIGSPATGKNVLSVGATENVRDQGVNDGCNEPNADNADDIAGFSSRGPTADQRIKPDITAPGTHVQGPATQAPGFDGSGVCAVSGSAYYPAGQTLYTWSSGTSHSAPAVAGAASLLWEYYRRVLKPGATPSPAMLKALLLNTPRYLQGLNSGDTLPSSTQGWGDVNLGNMFDGIPRFLLDQAQIFAATGQQYAISGKVNQSDKPFRVTLVWTDAPGPLTGNAYVNNLDLEVTVGGQTYKGNVMSGAFSAPGGVADARNNVESVFIPAGVSGDFSVRVVATNIAGDGVPGNAGTTDQDFALVVYNAEHGLITGEVRDAASGQPIPNARVRAGQTTEAQTNASGVYAMFVAPGAYALTASAYGYASQAAPSVTVAANTTSTASFALSAMPVYRVSGYVTSSVTGLPVMGFVAANGSDFDPLTPAAATDPSTGFYSLTLAGGQAYTLTASAMFHQNTVRGIGQPAFDQQQNFGLIPSTTNGGLRGRVTSAVTGMPLMGAAVSVAGVTTQTLTDYTGSYTLTGLAPGAYTATAVMTNYSNLSRGVVVPQSNFGRADFALNAARLAVSTQAISQSLSYGGAVVENARIVITNTGNAPLNWLVDKRAAQAVSVTRNAESAAQKILVLGSSDTANPAVSLATVTTTLAALGYTFDISPASVLSTTPVADLLAYESVVFVGNSERGGNGFNAKLMAYLDMGGKLLIADNDLGFYNQNTNFYKTYLQAVYLADKACGAVGNCKLAGEDILTGLSASVETDPYPDSIGAGSLAVPILVYADGAPAGLRVTRQNYRAVYLPFDFEFLSGPQARMIVAGSALEWLAGRLDMLPWLSLNPSSGTLAPGAAQAVRADWKAGFTSVSGSGLFTGRVKLISNDPLSPTLNILASLDVRVSANQAMLYGTVSRILNCGAQTEPVDAAMVLVQSSSGEQVRVVTSADGQFGRQVPPGVYTITVGGANFAPVVKVAQLAANQTMDVSVTFPMADACLSYSPAQIIASAPLSQAVTARVVISASSSQPAHVAVREMTATTGSAIQSGGPDAGGYTFVKTGDPFGPPFIWMDVTDGQPLMLGDEGMANVTLPFTFKFYSLTVSALGVSNNGGILLNTSSGSLAYLNTNMASAPAYLVAPFWDDLDASAGQVYFKVMGIAPNRKAVVSWVGRPHYTSNGDASVQAVFYENGSISFEYLDTNFGQAAFDGGTSATIGIKGRDAANSLQVSYNAASVPSGSAVCFTPPGGLPCGGWDVPWLSVLPAEFASLSGAATLTVTLNASGTLPAGLYRANIALMSDSPLTPQIIPVTLLVSQTRLWLPVMSRP
ncbi:MAG TPA: S8 family serine peptidase [Thermoflexales bacterium]|nr:S8 family serine peptidase [Thermoflexales bacterium]HQW35419.1 S8 family serine peptidase [Thermoflexales bacterium]